MPYACKGCAKEGREVVECRIRIYQFSPHGRKCPREEPAEPKVIAEAAGDQYLEIPLELIYWRDPIRKAIRKEDVDDMATSFSCHGQIEPIVVEGPDEEGKYEGVCGRLRYEAMKRFQGRPILARVHKFRSAREKREWQLAENLHRRDLTAVQRAEAYKELYESMREEFGGVHDKHIVSTIAKRQEELTGEKPSESIIYDYMRVAELPEEVKEKIRTSPNFGVRHGKELLRLRDMPEKQLGLARKFSASAQAGKPPTVSQLKRWVDDIVSPPKPKELNFTCFFCGGRLSKAKLSEKIREAEADPSLYGVVKEQYREVFEILEQTG